MDPLLAKGRAKAAQHGVVAALDIYESFHIVQRQTSWGHKDPRVPFSKYAAGAETQTTLMTLKTRTKPPLRNHH